MSSAGPITRGNSRLNDRTERERARGAVRYSGWSCRLVRLQDGFKSSEVAEHPQFRDDRSCKAKQGSTLPVHFLACWLVPKKHPNVSTRKAHLRKRPISFRHALHDVASVVGQRRSDSPHVALERVLAPQLGSQRPAKREVRC